MKGLLKMRKIFKLYFVIIIFILCASFLLCGIAEINSQTSYVITGQKSDVVKAQNLNGKKVVEYKNQKENEPVIFSVNTKTLKNVTNVAKYCCVPPFGCIISAIEEIEK